MTKLKNSSTSFTNWKTFLTLESNRPIEPPLKPYQIECINWSKGRLAIPIMLPFGAGKTAVALKIAVERNLKSVLCVAPKATLEGWGKQIRKFSDFSFAIAIGNKQKRLDNILSKSNIILINPEGVRILEPELIECAKAGLFDAIIVDELTKFRRWSKQTQALLKVCPFIPIRMGLCGKLITENLFDPFNPFRYLDGGRTFGKDFFVYRDKYFEKLEDAKTGVIAWEPTSYGKKIINALVCSQSFVRSIEQIDVLPGISYSYRTVSLAPQQVTYLKVLQEEWVSRLPEKEDQQLDFTMQILQKAYQCINGFVYKDDGSTFFFDYNPKLQELNSILEEHGNSPFIVWYNYKAERAIIESLLEKIGKTICPREQHNGFDDGDWDAALCSFAKDAYGLNLRKAPLAIYFSRPQKFADYDQSQARNRRADSEFKLISCQIISSKHQIERMRDMALRKKRDLSNYVSEIGIKNIWTKETK